MITLTRRSYGGETDLPAIADLINACHTFDGNDDGTTVAELQFEFQSPSVNPVRDLRLWFDGDHQLIAFAQLWLPEPDEVQDGVLWFNVHPQARWQGLEPEILAWGETQLRHIGQERAIATRLQVPARDNQIERMRLLEQSGLTAIRHFDRLERSLHEPIPAPQLPANFTLRSVSGAAEIPAWVKLFNQSFIDHWNHHDLTVEECRYWQESPTYDANLDLVAVAPDGTLAAFCKSEVDVEYNTRTGRRVAWVNLLGTRRGFRRMGLGRAMLLDGLQRLRAIGMETARIGVDRQNPSGARHLYESVGFRQVLSHTVFIKPVSVVG